MRDNFDEKLVLVIGIGVSALNMALTIVLFHKLWKTMLMHRNCKILAYSVCFAYFCTGFGEFGFAVGLAAMPHCPFPLAQEFVHVQSDCDILRTFRIVMLHGVLLLEVTNLAVSVERTLATVKADYERIPYALHGGFLLLSSHAMGVIMSLAYWTWKLPIAAHNFIRVGLNVLCFLYCATLYRYNRRLNEANHKAGGRLSVRYQLTENERIIGFLFPLQILHCVVQTSLCFSMSFVQATSLRELSVTLYFLILNVHVTISFAIIGRNFVLKNAFQRWVSTKGRVTPIVDNDTVDTHFRSLKTMWL